ncbi:GFA family protein, partial [Paludibacterium sp.]|uniref:GFA family protein n=1 Tax=Paludibacterium sp. TaxID=1917523 RepID=UPI0025F90BD4
MGGSGGRIGQFAGRLTPSSSPAEQSVRSKYSGQCLCGGIHYSVDVDPVFAGNCHCKDCQRTSGSAFVPAMVFPEKDVVISGEAKYFASTADSGNTHSRGFCPHCGS